MHSWLAEIKFLVMDVFLRQPLPNKILFKRLDHGQRPAKIDMVLI